MGLGRVVKSALFGAVAAAERAVRPEAARIALGEVKNFLLMQHPTALGTAVHATPMVPALRAAVPGCRVAVVASGLALEVFANNPGVDRLIPTPSPLRDLRGAIQALRAPQVFAGELFAAITTVGNERTRVGLQALGSGAYMRVGFTEVPEVYLTALRFDPELSLIDNNLRIVAAFAGDVRHEEPQMFPSAADDAFADRLLAEGGVQPGQMVAAFVTQTSVTQRKGWRPERFQAAARFLIERYGAHIVFVGTAGEAAAIETLRAGVGHGEATSNVAGKTRLHQLAALLRRCRVGLTLDSGTLHVGRTVGLPMVIVAPAWSPVLEWLPVGNPRYRILKNAEMAICPLDYVIDEVSVEEATAALRELIAAYPMGARSGLVEAELSEG